MSDHIIQLFLRKNVWQMEPMKSGPNKQLITVILLSGTHSILFHLIVRQTIVSINQETFFFSFDVWTNENNLLTFHSVSMGWNTLRKQMKMMRVSNTYVHKWEKRLIDIFKYGFGPYLELLSIFINWIKTVITNISYHQQ